MTRRLLSGFAAATVLALASAAFASAPVPQLDPPNYEPGIDGSQWGMQAPAGTNGEDPNLPPVQQNTIESIKFEENPALNGGFLFIPPDPHCAVGPNHIITIVNCAIQWYPKTGGPPQNQQPLGKQVATVANSFFNSLNPANGLFDPRVIYDQYNGRFIVCADEQVANPNSSRMLFAVSDDSDPNGTWYFFSLNTMLSLGSPAQNTWLDYPAIACDQNVVYLTGNFFNFAGTAGFGSRQFIINKNPWYAGGAVSFNAGNPFDAAAATGFPNSTMMPTQMFGVPPAGVGTWFVLYSGLTDGVNEYLQTIRCDNPTGVPSFFADQALMGNIDTASGSLPRGEQPGSINTATRIDTGDRRALQALWRGGNLYTVFEVNPPSGVNAGQCTAHWVKEAITTGAGAIVDQGNLGGEDVSTAAWTNYPSIGVDKLGNIALCCGVGSPTMYASAAYTTRSIADAPGFTNALTVYASGQAFYRRTFSSSTAARNRWGDYTGTVVDPDGCTFWSYNEYAGTQGTPTTVSGVTEDGRWWTRAVNYFVDDNRNGISDPCEPVAVVLSKFEVVRDGTAAIIRWSVSEANDHLGFNVFRETDGGARVILHDGLLTGDVDYVFRDDEAPQTATTYWLQEVDRSGKSHWIGSIRLDAASALPMIAELSAARPNPFNQSTTVQYSLGSAKEVNLSVYDIQGRKVATLVEGTQDAGTHSATWNGRNDNGSQASSGFYFMKLQTAGFIKNVKVVLTRSSSGGTQ